VSPGAARVYVYYRVRPADASAVIAAVRALHARLQAAMPGLSCTLSRRAEQDGDLLTLMETYAHADGVPADWQGAIERGAQEQLAAWIVGARHVEVFVPCA
jgi:quinol monooxygenase YgiN